MENKHYYQEKYEDMKRDYGQVTNELENTQFYSHWLIAIIILLILGLIISLGSSGNIINNEGYTLEQVTNATIQICNALK